MNARQTELIRATLPHGLPQLICQTDERDGKEQVRPIVESVSEEWRWRAGHSSRLPMIDRDYISELIELLSRLDGDLIGISGFMLPMMFILRAPGAVVNMTDGAMRLNSATISIQLSRSEPVAKKKAITVPPKLTNSEQDLLTKLQHGYQLETDSLGGDPVLRNLKDNEMIRTADANASTVKAVQNRGLIRPGKERDPLTIVWRLGKR